MLNWARNDIVINWAGGLHHGKRSEVCSLASVRTVSLRSTLSKVWLQ